ncbi:MAG TPA: hypothetical protein VID76_03075 [Solirubrobacterales bacterium]
MRRALTIAVALVPLVAALAVGCGGGDESAAPSTLTVSTAPTSTATTTTAEPAPDAEGAGGTASEQPQPGSGSGAPNAVIAAAAVLTRGGTPQQACGTFVTEAFISTAYGGEENCVAARRPEALARSILVGPEGDASSTTITVVPDGGPYDGVKVAVDLVEEDGGFRVDGLDANVPAGP